MLILSIIFKGKIKMNNNIKLDKYQLKAVTTKRKKVLVLAGAGSGKTLVIESRIRYLVNNLNAHPKDILCISFTNDATKKLKNDLHDIDVEVMTFHKLGLKIINNKKEILTEDILKDIVMDTFSNYTLLSLFDIPKSEMINLIVSFINMFKSNGYKLDNFNKFIRKADYKEKLLLKEIMKCFICYESYLKKENLIDFNDMINIAYNKLEKAGIRYKYIIIDEYQDTSFTKFKLIKKLIKLSNASFFAVGDDFQSIYRFTGTYLKVITNFKRYFPFASIIKLKNTYRNPDKLIKIAGKFVMKNPYQIRKRLRSNIKDNNVIQIVYYEDLESKIKTIINEDKIDNLFVLSRNNRTLNKISIDGINCRKLTVHKSKGLEMDYVFVLDLNNNGNGFPNKYKDHKILKYVNNYKEYYPYEEERRLFYVALTRCKKRVYLFVPKDNESVFIKELIKMNKDILIR